LLTFDFPEVQIGVAEYEEGPTGATVLYFPKPVVAAVDVRGGAPGTVNTDILRLAYDEPTLNAIVLSGGSSYGLSAATGVANALKDEIADSGNFDNVAVVAGATSLLRRFRFDDMQLPFVLRKEAACNAQEYSSVASNTLGARASLWWNANFVGWE